MKQYDFLLVGSGLFNAIIAREAIRRGQTCLVVEKRNHLGGNLYCENMDGIIVHTYGPHIFHTGDKKIWDYVNELGEFLPFINTPLARYKDKLYNLPFNMNTFYQLWGVTTPEEARIKLEEQRIEVNEDNLKAKVLSLVGRDIYETLVKGYTEKQWGKSASELPSFIIQRLPLRFTFDNNYFQDCYQGIPAGGYNPIIENCFNGCDIELNVDYLKEKDKYAGFANKIVFTGMIDEYFAYTYGPLEYRSLRFENQQLNIPNYQGNAIINYTEREIPYTRIIEHKHFDYTEQPHTIITREYPKTWQPGEEAFYPINTPDNNLRYEQYRELAAKEKNIFFGGRLGLYKYLDMDKIVSLALRFYTEKLNP